MSTRAITTLVTTCDRPRCNRVLSEREEGSDPPAEKEPDFLLKRTGKPDVRYPDLCDICTKAVDNYVLGIEKKPRKKEDAAPVDPSTPRFAMGVWMQDGRECNLAALEGVTDPAEAGALIAAYEEAE